MIDSVDFEEVYGLLTHLCEEQLRLADDALFFVMDAFNELSELHVPGRVCEPVVERSVDRLGRSLELLDRLVGGSQRLQQTLTLMRVRRLLSQALEVQR